MLFVIFIVVLLGGVTIGVVTFVHGVRDLARQESLRLKQQQELDRLQQERARRRAQAAARTAEALALRQSHRAMVLLASALRPSR